MCHVFLGHVPHGRHGYRRVSSVWCHQTAPGNASGTMMRTGQYTGDHQPCLHVDSAHEK